jgi:hypothetical protein
MNFFKDKKYCLVIFFVWFIAYFLNVTSQLFGGDSAEFSRVLVNWEVAHPPGYPLYALVANIFSLFFSQKQYSLSLLNAIFNLITAIFLFDIFFKLTGKKFASFLTAVFYLINFLFWFYGLVPEVFSLAILLIAIQYNSILALSNGLIGKDKIYFYKYLFILSLALSVANHHIFLFFIPGYFYLFLKNKNIHNLFIKNIFIDLVVFVFFSLVFYIYIPATSHINNYIGMTNTKTLTGLIEMITRAPYGTFKAYGGAGSNFANMFFDVFSIFIYLFKDFRLLGVLFIFFGLIYLKTYKKQLFYFFGINSLSVLFFYFYSNFFLNSEFGVSTFERFIMFIYISCLFYVLFGVIYFHHILSEKIVKVFKTHKLDMIVSYFVLTLFVILLGSIYRDNIKTISELKSTKDFYNLATDILETPEANSIVMFSTDNTTFLTNTVVKNFHFREDLVFFNLGYLQTDYRLEPFKNKLFIPQDKKSKNLVKNFLDGNYKKGINIYMDRAGSEGYWTPVGLLWKYYPSKELLLKDTDLNTSRNIKLWQNYHIPQITANKIGIPFIQDIKSIYARAMWSCISMLHLSSQNELALTFAEKYIDEFYYEYFFRNFYVDLRVTLKKCDKKLDDIVSKMIVEKQKNLKEFKDYLIISNYFGICKNDKVNEKLYFDEYQRLKDLDRVPINEI